jgi:hypothetical protein
LIEKPTTARLQLSTLLTMSSITDAGEMNPIEMLHSHHLSRQIGRLHERVNGLDEFRQNATDRLTGQQNNQNMQELPEDFQQLKQDLMSNHQAVKNGLQTIGEDMEALHKHSKSLRQSVQVLSSAQNDTEIILSSRMDAIDEAQSSTNLKLDSMHQLLSSFGQSNEKIIAAINEVLENQTQIRVKKNDKRLVPNEPLVLSSNSTTNLVGSSPPLARVLSPLLPRLRESSNILSALNSEHGMFKPIKVSKASKAKVVENLSRCGQAKRSGSSRHRGLNRLTAIRKNMPPPTSKLNGLMGFGFVVVGEPHELHKGDHR